MPLKALIPDPEPTKMKSRTGSVNMEVWFAASREINPHPWHKDSAEWVFCDKLYT